MDCSKNSMQICVDEIGEHIAVPKICFKNSELKVKYVEFRKKSTTSQNYFLSKVV